MLKAKLHTQNKTANIRNGIKLSTCCTTKIREHFIAKTRENLSWGMV